MIISVTEINAWKRCRWQWLHNSYNGFAKERAITLPAFALGTLSHASIQYWLEHPSASREDVLQDYDNRAWTNFQAIMEHYKAHMSGIPPSQMELHANTEASKLGRAMVGNYYDYYSRPSQGGGPLPNGYSLIAAEQTLTVPIPHTEHCLYNEPMGYARVHSGRPGCDMCGCGDHALGGSSWCSCRGPRIMDFPALAEKCSCCVDTNYLEGTFDGVVVLEAGANAGDLYPIDHKTFSRHPTDDGLLHNEQFLRYLWLSVYGEIVPLAERHRWKGFLYNGLWKRATVPNGRIMDDMFHRALLPRSQDEIDRCTVALRDVSLEMCYAAPPANLTDGVLLASPWTPHVPVYKTVPPVDGCNGLMQCVFKDVCDDDELSPDAYQRTLAARYVPRQRTPAYAIEAGATDE